jgi:hypothetical protein
MFRRRLLLGAGAVALFGAVGFVVFLWFASPTPGVTWENFHRLQEGMSARDVEALLGEPTKTLALSAICTRKCWWSEEIEVLLDFNADDRLGYGKASSLAGWQEYTGHAEYLRKDETILDRIRRWLLHAPPPHPHPVPAPAPLPAAAPPPTVLVTPPSPPMHEAPSCTPEPCRPIP